jgi:hypothetical protein
LPDPVETYPVCTKLCICEQYLIFRWHCMNQLPSLFEQCDIYIEHSSWLMLTTSADLLNPNSPQGLGVANRCSARLQIFQEGNPAASDRSLCYRATNYVIFSTPTPQCIASLCLLTRLKPTESLNWFNLRTDVRLMTSVFV